MSERDSDFGAFLAGFVFGALVGAATALILAPQSGEATRRQLAGAGDDLRHAADDYSREYRDRATQVFNESRQAAQNLGDQVQSQARIILDSGRDEAANHSGNSTPTS